MVSSVSNLFGRTLTLKLSKLIHLSLDFFWFGFPISRGSSGPDKKDIHQQGIGITKSDDDKDKFKNNEVRKKRNYQ